MKSFVICVAQNFCVPLNVKYLPYTVDHGIPSMSNFWAFGVDSTHFDFALKLFY